jgi:flagellar motor component MotA
MTRKKFIDEYTRLLQLAIALADKSQKQGLLSLEGEIEDIADEYFKNGLRFVVGGIAPRIIDEIMTNRIANEKDKQKRILKTVQKRAVLGIQAGESFRVFYHVLKSIPPLTEKEENKIDYLILYDEE